MMWMRTSDAPAAVSQSTRRTNRARLIIAEDHRVVAAGLRTLLTVDYSVVALTHSGSALLAALHARPADCLLLGLMLSDHHGVSLISTVRKQWPDLKIVVLTMLVDRVIANACIAAGAQAFVPKAADDDELRHAIDTTLAGGLYLSPRVPRTNHPVSLEARRVGLERLTPRDQDVMLLLGEGKRPAQIAAALGVGPSAVTYHLQRLMRALGAPTQKELVRLAVLMRACEPSCPPPRELADYGRRREVAPARPAIVWAATSTLEP
jgi:DNA-binding NarL/FixJ family response regulator